MLYPSVQIVLGLILLVIGGEFLVKGAVGFARKLGISAALIGLTIVAYGTSTPELVVSVQAAIGGYSDISLGNVVGSNICNILLIIGLATLITPIAVVPKLVRKDAILMVAVAVLLIVLSLDREISRLDGIILFTAFISYTLWIIRQAKKERDSNLEKNFEEETSVNLKIPLALLYMAGGLVLLVIGSDQLVKGAVAVAQHFGVPEVVIGLTIVAVGTSMPELITSVVAAIRKHADIAVTNIIGSNLFNIFGILGLTGIIKPIPVSEQFFRLDYWVMLAVSVLFMAMLLKERRITRFEGGAMIATFVAYTFWLYYNTPA
jgi:cation:H+ antiporter